jgi:uncharacterized OB-fold protein
MTVSESARVNVVEGLFAETAAGPRLLGTRCTVCGTHYFPRTPRCTNPTCRSASVEEAMLGPKGVLFSYTVQHYPPPAPFRYDQPFQPYGVGLVELEQGLRVIALLKLDPAALKIGMPLELVIDRLATDEKGRDVVTWKFAPGGDGR